ICYGMQLLAQQSGGHVAPASGRREYGPATLEVLPEAVNHPLFEGITASPAQTERLNQPPIRPLLRLPVWMSHGDSVDKLPPGFSILACTESNTIAAISDPQGRI